MSAPYVIAMPPDLDIPDGWTIRVKGISATDGSDVANISIGETTITAEPLGTGTLESGGFVVATPVLIRQTGN